MRQAQAAGGSGRDRYGYSVSVLLPTHHKKVRTCRTRQIRARSPGSDFLMIRIQMPEHWNNHSAPTPIRPQPGPDAMARGCVPREPGDSPTSVLAVLVFYICEIILLLFLLFSGGASTQPKCLWGGGGGEEGRLLVSSAAGTKAGRQEKRADRANYGELLKDFSSMCT